MTTYPCYMRKPNVRFEVVLVDPDLAAKWLITNERNRRLSRTQVARYSQAMADPSGLWFFMPDCIGFYGDGEDAILASGQDRLTAIIDAQVAIWIGVIWGLDLSAAEGMDLTRRRTATDLLTLDGHNADRSLAAAYRYYLTLQRVWSGQMKNFADSRHQPTIHDIRNAAREISLDEFLPIGRRQQNSNARMPTSLTVALAAHFTDYESREAAEAFFYRLSTGRSVGGGAISTGGPVWELRERLTSVKDSHPRRSNEWYCAVTVNAWNNAMHHVAPVQVSFKDTQSFPQIGQRPSRSLREASKRRAEAAAAGVS